MNKRLNVAVVFGGKSLEHEVSIVSAQAIFHALKNLGHNLIPIAIDKKGFWHHIEPDGLLENLESLQQIVDQTLSVPTYKSMDYPMLPMNQQMDVVFPIIHGYPGEDGCLQGLLRLLEVPFVGADVLGSAICMDKDVSKRLVREAGLKTTAFVCIKKHQDPVKELKNYPLTYPLFVKPADSGSSVGISKVQNEKELLEAVDIARRYCHKTLIEEAVEGMEIECSVLGNEFPKASLPGRIIPKHAFYSYEAKYLDDEGAAFEIPAKISDAQIEEIQKQAVAIYQILEGEGLGRVDFFLSKTGELFFNEMNTIPGFTPISLYPQLWKASGLAYESLIEELLVLAMNREERRKKQTKHYLIETPAQ